MGRRPQSCGCQHGRVQRLIVNGRHHARGPRLLFPMQGSNASIARCIRSPPARAVLQDIGLVGISQRVSGTLHARRLLGGDILLERAHYEISPFAVDNKRASWVALPDPKAQRLTAARIGRLVNTALAVKGSPNERAVSDWQATVTAGHPADGCLGTKDARCCGGCGTSFATSHTKPCLRATTSIRAARCNGFS